MTRVKICGITNETDALRAAEAGADALGFVFAPSPRRVAPDRVRRMARHLPPLIVTVGVFQDAELDEVRETLDLARLDLAQLHGSETPDFCERLGRRVIRRIAVGPHDAPEHLASRVGGYAVSAILLDPGCGGGRAFPWVIARGLPGRLMIAGGLTPVNVSAAIRTLRPYAVDVCSGVEREPGVKDADKMRAFVRAVRQADAGD
jgi:phosphoribosylanthranilate isomerase